MANLAPELARARQLAWEHAKRTREKQIIPIKPSSCLICKQERSARVGIKNYGRLLRICASCARLIEYFHDFPHDPVPFTRTH